MGAFLEQKRVELPGVVFKKRKQVFVMQSNVNIFLMFKKLQKNDFLVLEELDCEVGV